MSDIMYRLIPAQLDAQISKEQARSAVQFLRNTLETDDVVYVIAQTAMFVDCGERLRYIGCPHCHKKLHLKWWAAEMARCSETGFEDRDIIFPCCKRQGKLEELEYREPCGLAKIVFEIREPNGVMDSEMMNTLRLILGCDMLEIISQG